MSWRYCNESDPASSNEGFKIILIAWRGNPKSHQFHYSQPRYLCFLVGPGKRAKMFQRGREDE